MSRFDWSLGITLIEMAQGQPPHAHIHPMRAIFIIPTKEPPTLDEPTRWPPELVDFLAKCVVKIPANRPSAESLLSHAFVSATVTQLKGSNGKSAVLMEMVNKCLPLMDDYRSGLDNNRDDGTGGAGGTLLE